MTPHALPRPNPNEAPNEVERLRAELAEWNTADRHRAFTHCAQNIGHVTMAAFGEKIAEKVQERAEREQAERERDALKAAIERARALHKRSMFPATSGEKRGQHYCVACTALASVDDYTGYVVWPCPTVAALDTPSTTMTCPACATSYTACRAEGGRCCDACRHTPTTPEIPGRTA